MKKSVFLKALALLFIGLQSCNAPKSPTNENPTESASDSKSVDFKTIATLLVARMDLQPGEKVLLVGLPNRFESLVNAIAGSLTSTEAEYLGTLSTTDEQPENWSSEFVNTARALSEEELQIHLGQVDVGIMLPGAIPQDLAYHLIQKNLEEGMGRTVHFHWSGAYDLNGGALEISPMIDEFYQDVLMTTDYEKLAEDQRIFEKAIRETTIQVTTPSGTDISFSIGDRPVTKQDGDASAMKAMKAQNLIDREIELPAGAIRVAPIETSVNGVIAFPDSKWGETDVTGLVMTFEEGKVTRMEATSGLESVELVMEEAGPVASSFREFALGLNPKLSIPDEDPWIPYYGYGAGVVRLSLGDNTELGGNVTGGFVRWNFFTDATVKVGEAVWVENGKLIK